MSAEGLLRIHVRRGINLAVRDNVSNTSDPYVVIRHAGQEQKTCCWKVKTSVVSKNCNPVWNDNVTIPLKDPNVPIRLQVFDKDTFTDDDEMGNAEFDVRTIIECLRMGLKELPDGTKVDRVQPSRRNCLADESCVVWNKGKMTQKMLLNLRNVERGQAEIEIELVDFSCLKSPLEY